MKEHIQKTGVRKYAGDDLIELQAEPLKAIQSFFKEYEDCIINGCEVVPAGSRYNVTPGLVSLRGTDAGGNATAKVAEFAGVADVALPVFLTLANTVSERVYGDGKVKPVAYNYTAIASGVRPAAGIPCLEITAAGGRRFVDAVKITEKLDKVGNGKDVTVTFAQAATRENIASGEKLTVILGKIIRWLADLKALAFKDKVSKTDMDAALQGELDGKEPVFTKNSAFNKNFGSAAGTVCQGNDARLSDARVSSDVSAWAKAASKPNYNFNEINYFSFERLPLNSPQRKKLFYSMSEHGYLSFVAIGANRRGDSWGRGLFSVGTNDAGTTYTDFEFDVNGKIYSPAGTFALTSDIPTKLPANGGNADTTNKLCITNERPNHGNGLVMNQDINIPGAPNQTDYFSYLRLLHPNPAGYFSELAMPFTNSTRMYYRNMRNGILGGWNPIAFLSDIPTSLPASGGNADTVGGIGATSLMRKYMITVGGDSSHLYPCTWTEGGTSVYMSIHSPSLGGGDAYNQNEITFLMSAAGWSDMPQKFMCLEHGVYQPSEITIHSIYQGLGNGMNCIYLRGGAYYTVFSNTTLTPNSSPVTSGIEIFGVMNNDGTVSTTNAAKVWSYTEGVSWLGKYGTQTMQGNLTLDTSNASYVSLNRNNESVAYMGLGSTTKKDLLFQLYQSGNFIRIGEDGKNYSNNKEIATVDQIKVLSGGAAATAGQYVSGITVNDHEITVMKAALPTSTADIFEVANKKYVTDAEKADWNGKAPANHTHPYAPDNHNHDASYAVKNHTHNYEPAFSKNTAFNRYFGTTAGTVAQGNHTHAGVTTMKAMYEFTIKGIILNKDLKKGTNTVTSSIRNSGGNYTINHNLGHDNYVVILGIGKREDGATLVKAGLIGQDATCFKVQVSWGDQYHDGGFYATILTF